MKRLSHAVIQIQDGRREIVNKALRLHMKGLHISFLLLITGKWDWRPLTRHVISLSTRYINIQSTQSY